MLPVINPATGQFIREVAEDTAESVRKKFLQAKEAQGPWAKQSLEERAAIVQRFRELIVERTESLAAITVSEVGKPITQSRNELKGLLGRIDFFLNNVGRVLAGREIAGSAAAGTEERITLEPLGVVGNISAWNYPYFVGSNVFVPALLTGNAVLYKPSEFATLTGLALADLWHEAGVPQNVFVLVVGGGAIGRLLVEQPLNGVFFTGSYATGCKVAEAAARHLMKVQLELGGKDPVYVTEDVDVQKAAESVADGAFYNCGQSCCAVERVYVHEKIYDAFVSAFVATAKNFVMGNPMDDKTYIGPLTRAEHLSVLEKQVADAMAKGAKLLCGGKRRLGPGNYFEPTVFTGVCGTMELMREETFGPLIGIEKVASDDEAARKMNDTAYGLTAGVYSKSRERAEGILAQINAGSVYWNCCDRVSPTLPWSGRGHSGTGSTLSESGIMAFVQPKAWHLRPASGG